MSKVLKFISFIFWVVAAAILLLILFGCVPRDYAPLLAAVLLLADFVETLWRWKFGSETTLPTIDKLRLFGEPLAFLACLYCFFI